MEFSKQKNVIDKLNKYCYLSKEDAYISVSEWSNGEGYDIDINGEHFIHLTNGELDAINFLTKSLSYYEEGK